MSASTEIAKQLIRPDHFPVAPALLALDLDGTLLRDDHSVSESTKQAVFEASEAGLHVILASSRPPLAILPYVDELGLYGNPIVALQGALICKYLAFNDLLIIEQSRFEMRDALHILNLCDEAGVATSWYQTEQWSTNRFDPYILEEAHIVGFDPRLDDLRTHSSGPAKILVTCDNKALEDVKRSLAEHLPHMSLSASKPGYLEITPDGVNKAKALDQVRQRLGVDLDATVAVGDGDNDLEMLAWAATSVAPANATRAASQLAKYSTTSNMHDGVATVLYAAIRSWSAGVAEGA